MAYQVIPIRFISAGYGNAICANSIMAVLVPDSAPNKRRLTQARESKRHMDMTGGHGVRSLLLLDNGWVAGCAVSPKTVLARLNAQDIRDEEDAE